MAMWAHPSAPRAWNGATPPTQDHGSGASTPLGVHFPDNGGTGDYTHEGIITPRLVGIGLKPEVPTIASHLHNKLKNLQQFEVPPPGLPPPGLSLPQPYSAMARQGSENLWQVSIGSVGHPFTCAVACPYSPGECPSGAQCKMCHECPLNPRASVSKNVATQERAPATAIGSLGSLGHPHSCGNACKYVKRKSGCRNGSRCLDCHICHWQRKPLPVPAVQPQSLATQSQQQQRQQSQQPLLVCAPCESDVPAIIFSRSTSGGQCSSVLGLDELVPSHADMATQACPSVGSIGHPHSCGMACKYVNKQKGCKDGKLCVCCHLCIWRRYQQTTQPAPVPPLSRGGL